MRGGGDTRTRRVAEKKQAASPERPEQKCDEEPESDEGPATVDKDEVLRQLEGNEECQKIIECPKEVKEMCNRRCRGTWRKSRNCRDWTRSSWRTSKVQSG